MREGFTKVETHVTESDDENAKPWRKSCSRLPTSTKCSAICRPAGAEHMATLVKGLRAKTKHSVFVSAGDLIGASPLLSALFHDEPTIESLSAMGLEITAVGNHEFDEGKDELLRLQHGGCHPTAGCRGPRPFTGAKFRYLAANMIDRRTGQTLFPAYEVKEFEGIPVAFIGLSLKNTPPSYRRRASPGSSFATRPRP